VRIKEFSPSSWAKKHHFAVRVISSLAAGRTITFRSKQYGSRLAGVLGISNETFWAAMRRNCEMPANAWSGIIQKRLQDAFESDATYGKGENGEKVKVLPTRKEFAAKVGVRYDTLFRLIGTGDIGVVQFVNREKIRRFLNMDHKTWNEAIQRKPDNRQTLIGVLGKRNAAVSRGSLASGDDEIRLLSLWRKIQGGPNAKRNCDMLFGVLNKCLRSARNSTKTGT
jgi:hypothetical protein